MNRNLFMKSNLSTDETAECESGELTSVDAILIQVTDVNLNRGMILGGDESICRRAEIRCHNEVLNKLETKKQIIENNKQLAQISLLTTS